MIIDEMKGGDRMSNARTSKAVTPKELAAELNIDAKRLRGFLRKEFSRDPAVKGSTWAIDAKAVKAARARFAVKA
jgi:hypothetical protein